MPEVAIIVLISSFVLSLLFTRDIFHPAVLVSGLWGGLVVLYHLLEHPLWDLTDNFYKAIILWVIPFVVCSYTQGLRSFKIDDKLTVATINEQFYKSLYKYILIYAVGFIFAIIVYAGGLNTYTIRVLLLEGNFPIYLEILFYLNTFMTIYVLYAVMNPELLGIKRLLLLMFLLLIISLLKSNKTSFLAIFVSLAYLLKKKGQFSMKVLLGLVIALGALLVVVSITRRDYDFESDSAIENFLYIYLLSPLTAFDGVLNGEIFLNSGTWGESVLEFFYKVFNAFGADLKISDLGVWTNVPLPTNVYTAMRGPYLDGGYIGIVVVSIILGGIWGNLYAWQKKNYLIFVVFYAAMVSSLLFQSFGDYFFHSLSMTIQYYLFSIIICRGIRLRKTNYLKHV